MLLAAALFTAPSAQADDMGFLNALNASGIVVYDTQLAVTTGYRICNSLAVMNGQDVINDMVNSPDINGDSDLALAWLQAAGWNLCPWMYHPEREVGNQVQQPQLKRAT